MKYRNLLCAPLAAIMLLATGLFAQAPATVAPLTDSERTVATILEIDVTGIAATVSDSGTINPVRRSMRSNAKVLASYLRKHTELLGKKGPFYQEYLETKKEASFAANGVREYDRAMISMVTDSLRGILSVQAPGQPTYAQLLEQNGQLASVVRPDAFGNLATKSEFADVSSKIQQVLDLLQPKIPATANPQ